jgi:hypothetical protein
LAAAAIALAGADRARADDSCVIQNNVDSRVVWVHRTHASLRPHRHVHRITKRVTWSVFRVPTGHWHRVVRIRSWQTCEPVPPGRLQVTAREWSYLLSRPEVAAGNVIVELVNEGEDAHDLQLQLAGGGTEFAIPETESEQRSEAEFELTPGTYRLWCSLPTHDLLGMNSTLIVR